MITVAETSISTHWGQVVLKVKTDIPGQGLASLFGTTWKVREEFLQPNGKKPTQIFLEEFEAIDYYLMRVIKYTRQIAEIRAPPKGAELY